MNYRKLGRTEIKVSEIGFGAWGIGGTKGGSVAYGETDDRESRDAIWLAYEQGVTFFDTSDFYGYGHGEKLIGDCLKEVRSKVIFATKVGLMDASGTQNFSPEHIRRSVEGSLRRLKTDYLDVYQLHSPSVDLLNQDEEILECLLSLKAEGKTRALGISLRSPEDGSIAIKQYGFETIQVNFNLVDQRALDNGLLDLCERERVGVIIRTPLCFGFLTGAIPAGRSFGSTDYRSRWSTRQIERWATAFRLFEAKRTQKDKETYAQTALRYCLSFSSISTVIPGVLRRVEVMENVQASKLGRLSRENLETIRAIYQNNSFFVDRVSLLERGRARLADSPAVGAPGLCERRCARIFRFRRPSPFACSRLLGEARSSRTSSETPWRVRRSCRD